MQFSSFQKNKSFKVTSLREMFDEDHMLPIANVGRLMKQILPPSAKISLEAKQTMQECATEFISFVTGEATHKCHKENRRTVNGDDICWALSSLGLDNYAEALMSYLDKHREGEREKGNQNKDSYNPDENEKESTNGNGRPFPLSETPNFLEFMSYRED